MLFDRFDLKSRINGEKCFKNYGYDFWAIMIFVLKLDFTVSSMYAAYGKAIYLTALRICAKEFRQAEVVRTEFAYLRRQSYSGNFIAQRKPLRGRKNVNIAGSCLKVNAQAKVQSS